MNETREPDELRIEIEELFSSPVRTDDALGILGRFRSALNRGSIRLAEIINDEWRVNACVKRGIVLHARRATIRELATVEALPARYGSRRS
jgi:hypothetical protein